MRSLRAMDKQAEGKNTETITITVKFGLQNLVVSLPASSRVHELMQQLQQRTDVLPRVQKLIFKGKVLTEEMTLKNAQLSNGSKIMLMAAQGFQQRFPARRNVPPSKQAHSVSPSSLSIDESRLKAWKLTGIVSVRDSGLQKVPAAVWTLESFIRVLDVGGNNLSALPSEIHTLINIQRLRLSGNDLGDGSISWKDLSSLGHLSALALDYNSLTVLPPEIGQLLALKYLSVSHNQLTYLPNELGNLSQLEKLDVSHNRITEVPSSLGDCLKLVEINFSANCLTTIPPSFGQLLSLKIFLLDNNALRDFPAEVLQGCSELKTLSVHWNELTMDDLRQVDGWDEFNQRRKDKYNKQMDFRVIGSSSGFDEGADTEQWQRW